MPRKPGNNLHVKSLLKMTCLKAVVDVSVLILLKCGIVLCCVMYVGHRWSMDLSPLRDQYVEELHAPVI